MSNLIYQPPSVVPITVGQRSALSTLSPEAEANELIRRWVQVELAEGRQVFELAAAEITVRGVAALIQKANPSTGSRIGSALLHTLVVGAVVGGLQYVGGGRNTKDSRRRSNVWLAGLAAGAGALSLFGFYRTDATNALAALRRLQPDKVQQAEALLAMETQQ